MNRAEVYSDECWARDIRWRRPRQSGWRTESRAKGFRSWPSAETIEGSFDSRHSPGRNFETRALKTEYAALKAQGKLNLPSWTWALHKAVSHGYRTAEKTSLDVPRKRRLSVHLIHKECSRSDDPLMLTQNHRQRRGFTGWDLGRNWTWGQNHCLVIN